MPGLSSGVLRPRGIHVTQLRHFHVRRGGRTAAGATRIARGPAFDYGNVRGDEGQGPDYLFTWLRSILRVVEVAQARGQAVVHELSV